jgi:hypothetical protein
MRGQGRWMPVGMAVCLTIAALVLVGCTNKPSEQQTAHAKTGQAQKKSVLARPALGETKPIATPAPSFSCGGLTNGTCPSGEGCRFTSGDGFSCVTGSSGKATCGGADFGSCPAEENCYNANGTYSCGTYTCGGPNYGTCPAGTGTCKPFTGVYQCAP